MTDLVVEAVSDSEEQTLAFGERLGASLRSMAVVGLTGPIGAGKTRLVQGIARGAGYAGRVRSPSFALLHLYRGSLTLRHYDFYRLDQIDSGTVGEWEEEMESEGVSLVEWADRFPEILPDTAIWIDLAAESPTRRRIALRLSLPTSCLNHWRLP
jgi:tRNA threonylcarbamoyladenosine biosynthesis protein TsaE